MNGSLIDPRQFQPALPLPDGYTREKILEILTSVSIDHSARGDLYGYAFADCERFLHTLSLIPEGAGGKLIEIGANPYFTTLLVRRFRPGLSLSLVNYFGAGVTFGQQQVTFPGFDGVEETFELPFHNVNIEESKLPFADGEFDCMLFCEVLEHLTNDPVAALLELKRVIKPDGLLVLTTPNAARLETVVALLDGRNIYDQYSGYGPYGRHNREYTRHELHALLTHCGFDVEVSYTANVHPDAASSLDPEGINRLLLATRNREHDLGQYQFTRWRNSRPAESRLPAWLYRSYPKERMAP
ncbi:MAG: class I SAM-dependent methyltransferase [Xanthomonadales bacterium]|nr:class I SAM-dependent methyltransferase [Xanthomonadales bacterium]